MSRCLNARPGAPRDSAPAAVYVVFGPALKKLWKQKFKLVMALPTSRHGSKVSRNLGGFFRNNTTKFGGIQNETWAEAKLWRLKEAKLPASGGQCPLFFHP